MHQSSQPEYPMSSNSILPSQERIFELFSEAVTECENHARSDDQMIEANHQQIIEVRINHQKMFPLFYQ